MDISSWIVIAIVCAFLAAWINSSKGRSSVGGFFLGLLLGFIGVIIVAVLPKNEEGLEQKQLQDGFRKKCPFCAEVVKKEATVCKHCGRDLPIIVSTDEEVRISKEDFSKLTHYQKYAVKKFWYLLSSEDAEVVGKMLGSVVQERDIPAFCEKFGKKVISFED